MKHLVTLVAVLFLGIGTASADHHKEQPPGPERGQGLSGQGAESSGGQSADAISKTKAKKGKGHSKQDSDNGGDSDSGNDKKAKKDKKPKKDK